MISIGPTINIGKQSGVRMSGGGGYSPAALIASMVARYKLDETSDGSGAVTRVDSIGSADLTDTNNVPSTPGVLYDDAAIFDLANSESLSTADAILQVDGASFWFSCWARLSSSMTRSIIHRLSTGAGGGYNLEQFGSTFRLIGGVPSASDITINGDAVNIGEWAFVLCYWDAVNDLLSIQVNNGTPDTAACTAIGNSTTPFRLAYSGAAYWTGALQEVLFGKGYVPTLADANYLYHNQGDYG